MTKNLNTGHEICLCAIYLTFRKKHHIQVFATVMGSPISSVFANLVIEDVEKRSLETFTDPPRL